MSAPDFDVPRKTVFAHGGDAVLNCYRDRVLSNRRWIAPTLASIVDRLSTMKADTRPRRLDIVAHADSAGVLDFGGTKVLHSSAEAVRSLTSLFRHGVEMIGLVGCTTDSSATNLTALQGAVRAALPPGTEAHLLGTPKAVTGQHFGHNGLRREIERGILGRSNFPPISAAVFDLGVWFDANRLPKNHYETVTRDQLTQLLGLIETDYLACCLHEVDVPAGAPSMFSFQMPANQREAGRARIVAGGQKWYVVAESGRVPEVCYRVPDATRPDLEALIASWQRA